MGTRVVYIGMVTAVIAVLLTVWPATRASAQPAPAGAVQIDHDDIGGVVTGPRGPEAGVWVIAETTDLGTRFAKIVVTDARGRYVVPDLPKATYHVWVRGYGLVDSPKVQTQPGALVDLQAAMAPNAAAARNIIRPSTGLPCSIFRTGACSPVAGPAGNGMLVAFKSQEQWLTVIQLNGCGNCHQLGDKATREMPTALGRFANSREAWARRLLSETRR